MGKIDINEEVDFFKKNDKSKFRLDLSLVI
jgi:hypothetical protein